MSRHGDANNTGWKQAAIQEASPDYASQQALKYDRDEYTSSQRERYSKGDVSGALKAEGDRKARLRYAEGENGGIETTTSPFSRLRSQINRTGQQLAEGQARRNPYQSPQRTDRLMSQAQGQVAQQGEARAEAIGRGDSLVAGRPPEYRNMTAGSPDGQVKGPQYPAMTQAERRAVSRRTAERPWEDPYHEGGYSAGERAAGLPQSVQNLAGINARLRSGQQFSEDEIGQASPNMQNYMRRVNARLTGRQKINAAANRAMGRAEAPPWMQPGAAPPGSPGWTDPIEVQRQRAMGPRGTSPADIPHKDKYGREVLSRSDLTGATREQRIRAWEDARRRIGEERGGWPGWMGFRGWGDMAKKLDQAADEELGFDRNGDPIHR